MYFPAAIGFILLTSCASAKTPEEIDDDGDGYSENTGDCDDSNPKIGFKGEDGDCDGVKTQLDCDDMDPHKKAKSSDADCDGIPTDRDCDDTDAKRVQECIKLRIDDNNMLDLVLIPAGEFDMGSPNDEPWRRSNEVKHTVQITTDFHMMRTELTQEIFNVLTGRNPASKTQKNHPVNMVNWHEAAATSNALTAKHNSVHKTELKACFSCEGAGAAVQCRPAMDPYSCSGYRLPTESEWEYAARSGSKSGFWTAQKDGNLKGRTCTDFLLTNAADIRDYSWTCANKKEPGTKEVGLKTANDFGLHDMHGNVWEWTWDWYAPIYPVKAKDPSGPEIGTSRVFRGGSWASNVFMARSAYRNKGLPSERGPYLGFRLVRSNVE